MNIWFVRVALLAATIIGLSTGVGAIEDPTDIIRCVHDGPGPFC